MALIDALPDEERLRWQEREARFCEETDDLEALLDAHAHRHASEIHGAGP